MVKRCSKHNPISQAFSPGAYSPSKLMKDLSKRATSSPGDDARATLSRSNSRNNQTETHKQVNQSENQRHKQRQFDKFFLAYKGLSALFTH